MNKRPSPSLIIALGALFLALTGGAVAAIHLTKNSVRSKDIANGQVKNADLADNAVTGEKVKDGSLEGRDFAAGQLPSGPAGATGPSGPTGHRGATGSRGATGGQGPVGPSNAYFQGQGAAINLPSDGTWATIVSKSLPAGDWALTARLSAVAQGGFSGHATVWCEAWIGGTRVSAVDNEVASGDDASHTTEETMLGTAQLSSTQTASVRCHQIALPLHPISIAQVYGGQLLAIQAGSLH